MTAIADTRFATKIDLPAETRQPLIDLLNARLADLIDLQLQCKQAHWNVRGANFIALHELFDQLTDEVRGHVDEVAERIGQLGGIANGTVRDAADQSTLAAYPPEIASGSDHVAALSTALATAAANIRSAITTAGDHNDPTTEDLFTAISRSLDKSLWFVEAHVQG